MRNPIEKLSENLLRHCIEVKTVVPPHFDSCRNIEHECTVRKVVEWALKQDKRKLRRQAKEYFALSCVRWP